MWYKITDKYNGVKYKQGSWDIKEGLDCISMIVLFMKDMDKDVGGLIDGSEGFEYNGNKLTATTFLDYLNSVDEINEALKLFIQDQCVKVERAVKGDILYFKYRKEDMLGIYLGNGLIMCCFETYGVKKIKLRNFKITEIYRWV